MNRLSIANFILNIDPTILLICVAAIVIVVVLIDCFVIFSMFKKLDAIKKRIKIIEEFLYGGKE